MSQVRVALDIVSRLVESFLDRSGRMYFIVNEKPEINRSGLALLAEHQQGPINHWIIDRLCRKLSSQVSLKP